MTVHRMLKFYIFGDSICFGQHVSPHVTWVTRLSQLLAMKISPNEILINNASINGNTTRQALERMPYDIQGHRPDFLLIQFGMNDCNYWETDGGVPRVSALAFKANLLEMISRALNVGTKHIFLNTNHITPRTKRFPWANISYQESNGQYNEIIREVSDDASCSGVVTLIDIEHTWEQHISNGDTLASLVLYDEIHLSKRGHDIYFGYASPIIVNDIMKYV